MLSIYKELQTFNTRYPTDKWSNELNRKLSEEEIQMNIWKKCSTSLATRTALRFHLTPVRMKTKKIKKNKCRGDGERTPSYTAGGGGNWGGAAVEANAEVPQKTKHQTAMTQLSHFQDYTGRTVTSLYHGDIGTSTSTTVLFT